MTNSPVHQEGNTAGGHIAGRDVNVTLSPPPVPQTALGRLFARMKQEAAEDQTLCDYIKELEVFTRRVENEEVVGLDSKLQAAGREDQVDMATAMKELVFSQLKLNVFSPTFQQIYATLMEKSSKSSKHGSSRLLSGVRTGRSSTSSSTLGSFGRLWPRWSYAVIITVWRLRLFAEWSTS